jgi:hypothetical protein
MSRRKRSSQTQAAILASLGIAQEHARIIAASNNEADNDRPQTDSQQITDGIASAVTN